VIVVVHDSVREQVNGEDGREMFKTVFDPPPPMLEILSGELVLAAKKSASDATGHAVVVAGVIQANLLLARYRHSPFLPEDLANVTS